MHGVSIPWRDPGCCFHLEQWVCFCLMEVEMETEMDLHPYLVGSLSGPVALILAFLIPFIVVITL